MRQGSLVRGSKKRKEGRQRVLLFVSQSGSSLLDPPDSHLSSIKRRKGGQTDRIKSPETGSEKEENNFFDAMLGGDTKEEKKKLPCYLQEEISKVALLLPHLTQNLGEKKTLPDEGKRDFFPLFSVRASERDPWA